MSGRNSVKLALLIYLRSAGKEIKLSIGQDQGKLAPVQKSTYKLPTLLSSTSFWILYRRLYSGPYLTYTEH